MMLQLCEHRTEWHNGIAKGKGGCDDHEAHGLVEDDSPSAPETKKADEERQAKFRSAKPNKSAESADDGSTAEHSKCVEFLGRLWEHLLLIEKPNAAVASRQEPGTPD